MNEFKIEKKKNVSDLQTQSLHVEGVILFQARGLDLSRVRACVVVAEERPRMSLTYSFSKLFKDLGLHPRSVSTAFGCRVNLAICLQVKHLRSTRSKVT